MTHRRQRRRGRRQRRLGPLVRGPVPRLLLHHFSQTQQRLGQFPVGFPRSSDRMIDWCRGGRRIPRRERTTPSSLRDARQRQQFLGDVHVPMPRRTEEVVVPRGDKVRHVLRRGEEDDAMTAPLFLHLRASRVRFVRGIRCGMGGIGAAQQLGVDDARHRPTLFPQRREEGEVVVVVVSLLGREGGAVSSHRRSGWRGRRARKVWRGGHRGRRRRAGQREFHPDASTGRLAEFG
mmetsp:Transcript_27395/g.57861  ORF Transcript_27395/g.57861 Transcript_27395/m.57861 type:complete len:234 (-) Transcript_27395:116-817(-)